ncbi:lauroyl-Kdo(2)-lipid IV(A) myristoyltransferase, partial [Salmonella enterica subsp. enterica serovar Infantis]
GIALTPASFRDHMLAKMVRFEGRLGKSSLRRALINLSLCFPQRREAEREAIVDEMFATAPKAMAMMAELAMRGPKKI